MNELLIVLMTWLTTTSDLPPVQEPPRVTFVRSSDIVDLRSQLSLRHSAPARPNDQERSGPDVHAFYDDATRTIYLPRRWQASSPTDLSILVHELVHHVQNVGGLEYACAEAREQGAYRAQGRWLDLFGSTLTVEFGLDPMTLLVRTQCLR